MADSSGKTLMGFITSDDSSKKPPPTSSSMAPLPVDTSGVTVGALLAAKAAFNPVRTNIMAQMQKRRKSSQRQLIHNIFPKLAVYNSVDPSLAPSLLMLDQQCEDRTVLRYVYYYLARILSDSGSHGVSPGGGIPTPNWDALANIDASGGVTRADVVPRIVEQLTSEALNEEVDFHSRRLQELKALTYTPSSNSEIVSRVYEIVFTILNKVGDPQK